MKLPTDVRTTGKNGILKLTKNTFFKSKMHSFCVVETFEPQFYQWSEIAKLWKFRSSPRCHSDMHGKEKCYDKIIQTKTEESRGSERTPWPKNTERLRINS